MRDPAFTQRSRPPAQGIRRTAFAAQHRTAAVGERRMRGLSQARRSESHRRAQDQQRAGAGASRPADGKAAHHRRDRGRPARRRDGDGLRAVRPRLHRLHGRRGHAAAGAERLPHAPHGREGRSRPLRTRTLKDATSEAIRDWVTNVNDSYYIIGSVVGPAPYPRMVRDFQSVIGSEAKAQMLEPAGRLPRASSRAWAADPTPWGSSTPSSTIRRVELVGVEAAGRGLDTGEHSASLQRGVPGVLHGSLSYLLQDENGQVHPAHSISAGPRLSGCRAGAFLPQGYRPGPLRLGHGRRGRRGAARFSAG